MLITGVEEESPAAGAGLAPGDIIVELDQQAVPDTQTFNQLVSRHQKNDNLLLLVDRGGTTIYVTLQLQ